MRKRMMAGILAVVMVLATSITAFAGTWKQDAKGWQWDYGNGTKPVNKWEWCDGNGDGIAECYYFDKDGYCLLDCTTPDGYTVNKDGAWVDSRGYVGGYDKYGNPEFINGFLYDITERKTILERLQQMQNNLADANLELKKLTEKSERIAVEAEQANKEKTEFLTKLSHFIRTPMNAIIGACELLRDSKQAEEQKGISEEIIVNSNKLIEILNGILGKSNLELATIDVKSKKKPQTIEAPKVQPVHETKKKLLVVEDNKTNQKVVLAMLKKLGYTADIANDGAEALNILAYKYYDLIFMDCQMPIIDGLEATRRIRKGEGVVDPKVTIVALTANAMASDKAKCFEVGMNDFLSKPVTPKDIAGILEKWL